MVLTLRDGRVVRSRAFMDLNQAFAAAEGRGGAALPPKSLLPLPMQNQSRSSRQVPVQVLDRPPDLGVRVVLPGRIASSHSGRRSVALPLGEIAAEDGGPRGGILVPVRLRRRMACGVCG